MLRIGEQLHFETMLDKVATYYEKSKVDQQIKTILTIIKPVLMIVKGVFALTIVTAILLPIYSLVNQTGSSG